MRLTLAFAMLSIAGVATSSTASASHAAADLDNDASKKQRYLTQKAEGARHELVDDDARAAWQRDLDERIGQRPPELINIRNLWTHETLAVPRDPGIELGEDLPVEVFNWFLRCRFTHEPAAMDKRLVEVLVRAAERFRSDRVEVISGYRSDKHNLNLRKKGSRVARNSQHTHGTAVDFRIPGVHVSNLHRWARGLRLGGVGYYPRSGFVHVDTADVRYWTVR